MRLEVTNVMGYYGPSDDYSMIDQSLEMKRWSWKWALGLLRSTKCLWWGFSSLLVEGFICATARLMKRSLSLSLSVSVCLCLCLSLSLSLSVSVSLRLCPCTSIYACLVVKLCKRCMEADWTIFPDRLCGASEISDLLDCCFVSMLNYWNRSPCFLSVVKLN